MVHTQFESVWVLFSLLSLSLLGFAAPAAAPSSKDGGASQKDSKQSPTPKTQNLTPVRCASRWPTPKGTEVLSSPKEVTTKFDCGNKIYQNKGGPVFTLTKGASLSNCFFQQSGALDTVHVLGTGNFTLTNLYFLDTGDDGISIKGDSDVNVIGGGFLKAGNKAFQHDGSGKISVKGGCYENVHIMLKSCGNCKQNSKVKGRILEAQDISIYNVRTVCGVNTNRGDICTLSNVRGKPLESLCTGYEGISDPQNLPKQTSKNVRNPHCRY